MKLLHFIIILLFCWNTLVASEDSDKQSAENELSRAHKILEQYFQKPLDSQSIILLSGGFSKATNSSVNIDNKRYVLRIYKNDQSSNSEIQREFYALQEGAKVGISPRIHSIFAKDKAILMDYVSGNTISIDQAKQCANCIKIAEALRKAHAIEKNPYPPISLQARMEALYIELSKQIEDINFITEAIHFIRLGNAQMANMNVKKANIHGDLNPRNIFITHQSVLFIDWCDTNWEDPFYDLTNFSLLHGYSFEEEQLLLSTYLQHNPTEEEQRHFSTIKQINLASLCLTCHYIMKSLLFKFPDQSIDSQAPIKEWSYYIELFANSRSELPAQFFFEAAQSALKSAHRL